VAAMKPTLAAPVFAVLAPAILALAVLALMPPMAARAVLDQPCVAEAVASAGPLLRFHLNLKAGDAIDIEPDAKLLPPVKAVKGKGSFDVLEVTGRYIKATYRMRFIYAQVKGTCVLMGQEILEADSPY
jgi:hypothetical protein